MTRRSCRDSLNPCDINFFPRHPISRSYPGALRNWPRLAALGRFRFAMYRVGIERTSQQVEGEVPLLWPYRPSAAVSNRKWYGNCSLQHTSATSRTDKERNKHAMSSFRCQHFMWHTKRGNNVRTYSLSAPNVNAKLPEVSNRRSSMC